MIKAKVEGAILEVCEDCLKYGELLETEPMRIVNVRKVPRVKEETVIIDNYGKKIVEARKKMNLTRMEFAEKIGEKESVIRRVEREEIEPDDALTEKIEKFLEIKLRKRYEKKPIEKKQIKGELTLGDVVEIE